MSTRSDWESVLSAQWRATLSGPFFELSEPTPDFLQALPKDFLAAVDEFGGREGFLGDSYLRLYHLSELVSLNLAYEVPALLSDVIVFGSDGGGEAFAFRRGEPTVVQLPFVPLLAEYAERRAPDFDSFVQSMAASGESRLVNPDAVGMEVHDKHPICLGGSPTDPANKILVPVVKHAELCRFWNNVYRDAVSRQNGSGQDAWPP